MKPSFTFNYGIIPLILILFISSVSAQEMEPSALFDQSALQLISRQFNFTEGPSADKKGNVYFTDQPNNKIWKYDISGNLTVFMDQAGRANGTYFDQQGNLVACADEHQQLWSISPTKKVKILFRELDGKHLNGPNDLWIDKKGGIYITDPYYQRDYWKRKSPELKQQNVYYLPKGKKELILVSDQLEKPNGIIGSPDGKLLYVADITGNKIYRFSVHPDGELSEGQVVIHQGADGMTLDEKGNIYLAGKGVSIFNPEGIQIGHIEVNEPWTANISFGGKDNDILFITASTAFYKLPMHVKGAK